MSGVLFVVLLLAVRPALSFASDEDAMLLLHSLASESCEVRVAALSRYAKSEDSEQHGNAALKRLSRRTTAAVGVQVASLLTLTDDSRKGSAKVLALTEKASKFDELDSPIRGQALTLMRQELVAMIQNPNEPISARVGASWLLARMLLAATQTHPEWTTEWAQALETMLKSADASSRVVGAAIAALRRFPQGSDPATADVVRPLIDGLGDDSVAVRSTAFIGLRQALVGADDVICFSAIDPAERRSAARRSWESWWTNNRQALLRTRVEQRLW